MKKMMNVTFALLLLATLFGTASTAFASRFSYDCFYYDVAVDPFDHEIAISPDESKSVSIDHGKFIATFDNTGLLGLDVTEYEAETKAVVASFSLREGFAQMESVAGAFRVVCN